MYNVVLDTNILHEEGLNSAGMGIVNRLVNNQIINLHVPELVIKEFTTKKIDGIIESLSKASGTLKGMDRDIRATETTLSHEVDEIKMRIDELSSSIKERVDGIMQKWIDENRVTVLPLKNEYATPVFENYFVGGGVFRTKKERGDIPDAFINLSINELHDSIGRLVIIIKDGVFKKSLSRNQDFIILDSLQDLFELSDIKSSIENLDVTSFVSSVAYSQAMVRLLQAKPGYFESIYVEPSEGRELIADWVLHVEAEVDDFSHVENIAIDRVHKISEQHFAAKISFQMDSGISYVTDYGEVLKIERDKKRTADCWSMNGEGMCDVTESARLKFYGDLNIFFDVSIDSLEQREIDSYFEADTIKMAIDINDADIIKLL
ncbi:PIN domain-containing protein [Klebsiella variicola]